MPLDISEPQLSGEIIVERQPKQWTFTTYECDYVGEIKHLAFKVESMDNDPVLCYKHRVPATEHVDVLDGVHNCIVDLKAYHIDPDSLVRSDVPIHTLKWVAQGIETKVDDADFPFFCDSIYCARISIQPSCEDIDWGHVTLEFTHGVVRRDTMSSLILGDLLGFADKGNTHHIVSSRFFARWGYLYLSDEPVAEVQVM